MPKLFKSKIFLFTLFVVMIGSISSIKEQLRERELRQYVQWKPRPVIKDYEFIHNGEALVIEWDDVDERELIEEVNNGKPKFAYQLNTPNGASGERYIMQESYKLKASSDKFLAYRIAPDSAPYLSYNEPKEGEYWLIDVYDTHDRNLKPKTYDVFKMVRDYNKKYIPLDISEEIYETEDNEAYFLITMLAPKESNVVIENGAMKVVTEGFNETSQYPVELGLIDAKTGKISKKSSSGKSVEEVKTESKQRFENRHPFAFMLGTGLFGPRANHLSSRGLQLRFNQSFRETEKNIIPLASAYPKVYQMMKNQYRSTLYFLGEEDVEFQLSFLELLHDSYGSFVKNFTLPADFSIDEQEHLVQNKEEFLRYFKSQPQKKQY
ncbi:hypothetical protein GMC85_06855 [Streptococcus parasanguinis]|jgi:hypothetical protein|uniref:Uncharacterized protein n=1 Tax=Streptococcus parasanguinis TaxID=1318 RepID=A0A4Q5BW91_STRPA|nr:hypothetical protein [Streptococcus parasanguinis]MDB8628108.1 hypothetical protein [Streptococcus parasanguinis]MDU4524375.1 hypothetical protein [Streptococcus parasanguinis]MDU4779947.1 hypothetical protein [Streptococcus parasanguinis]MDU5788725.1 hypothetical protein [Streptococcus parasanguinis]MTR53973.1 hypothetical protein [Streptococcus parasanguinis]